MTATFPVTMPAEAGDLWRPADHDYLAWSGDPALALSGAAITAGWLHMARVPVRRPITVGGVALITVLGGAGLSNSYAVLYDDAGNRLGMSAELGTFWQAVRHDIIALTAPVDLPAGHVYAGFLVGAGTSMPQFASFGSAGSHANNANLPPRRYRSARIGLGFTAPPATINPDGFSGMTSRVLWAALA